MPVGAGVAVVAVAAPPVAAGDAEALGLDGEAGALALDGEAGALALLALADALGSSFDFGADAVPLIDAANAVRCVRTSCSLARADSSSVIAAADLLPVVVLGAVAVEPEVPVGVDALAPVLLSPARSSEMMRSDAATSLLQSARADVPDFAADFSSALMCFFSSATRVLVAPVRDAAGMSASADWA